MKPERTEQGGGAEWVTVATPAPLLRPLIYRAPGRLAPAAAPGVRVRAPLGQRRVIGVVLERGTPPPAGVEVKDILEVLDDPAAPAVPRDLLATVTWAAEHYLAPPGDVIRAALPAALGAPARKWVHLTAAGLETARQPGSPAALRWLAARPGRRALRASFAARLDRPSQLDKLVRRGVVSPDESTAKPRGAPVVQRLLAASDAVRRDPAAARGALTRSPARLRVLDAALAGPPLSAAELRRAARASSDAVAGLVRRGFLEERRRELPVAEVPRSGVAASAAPEMTPEQQAAVRHLTGQIDRRKFHSVVLYGITGSGKTEVYLRAAEHALARGRTALVLAPEIGLTPQLSETLLHRLGENVVVLHSGISDRQRYDAWRRARDGAARVVVGARSALFAPLPNLGLIVVDEEHDGGYKQEESPRYHARDLALVRGREADAVVVLGSATPSMEVWARAAAGQSTLLELPERVGGGRLARSVLVDMREEFRATGKAAPLSRALADELRAAVGRGEQAMVLLNRRGYAQAVLCRACGAPLACRSCSIALTWHRADGRMRCHYCGWSCPRPATCPVCASPHLGDVGEGTQRAEEALAEALPGARIARMDRDTVRSARRLADLLGAFARRETDVLVGTQIIAKGHHFPNVTLVGVLSADAALRLPDFRAAERTFQLLTQVSGRAGRGDRPGVVVVQAYHPDHPALSAALRQDYRAFAESEAQARLTLRYPPAAVMANLVVKDEDQSRALDRAADLAQRIRAAGEGRVAVLGPTFAPLARIQSQWRVQLLLRARQRGRLADALRRALLEVAGAEGAAPRWLVIDVDPLNLM